MNQFSYTALTQEGQTVSGHLEAQSESAAIEELRRLGHFPIRAKEHQPSAISDFIQRIANNKPRATARDLSIATHELAALLRAGLDVERAIQILMRMEETKRLVAPLTKVLESIRSGSSLGEAMSLEPDFPKSYVAMVRAGESTGRLAETLAQLSDYLMRTQMVSETIKSALTYPLVLLFTAGLSISFILLFVLPEFEELFETSGQTLPLITRITIGFGDVIRDFWWAIIGLVMGAIFGLRTLLKRSDFRRIWDRYALRIPIFGALNAKIEAERFARTLAALVHSGVALPTALLFAHDTIKNKIIADAIKSTAASVREGENFATQLASTHVFPAMTTDLLRVGEETGKLDEMLLHQADLYERSISHTTQRLLALLVPLMTVLLGIIIAVIIASLLAAVLSVNDIVNV